MADKIRAVRWARTVAFVPVQAISGGAILCLACDDLVIAPQARLGDAGQIMMGEDNLFRYVPEKERSLLVRQVRDYAEATGRPPALAEAMVDMNVIVYRCRNRDTGSLWYFSDAELDALPNPEVWEKLEPVLEARGGQFLTVNGARAVQLQLAAATASTRDELLGRYSVAAGLLVLEPTATDLAVTVLNWPLITGLLLVAGLVALYVELSAPGIGLGGLIAALCFSLFFWSRFLGGTAGWLEVILLVTGVAFVAVEFFVLPGFGIAGLSGLILIVLSLLMASQHFVIPSTERELAVTVRWLTVIAGSGIAFLVAAGLLSRHFGRLPVLGRLALDPPTADSPNVKTDKSSDPGFNWQSPVRVGDRGRAASPLRPAGKVLFGNDYVDVIADGTFIDAGQTVRVIAVRGNRVVVRETQDV
jgi:membrane-bound serine protease (ClpP class)